MFTRTLARALVVVLVTAGLAALTGCVKMEESSKVGADGKGTATITMTMDTSKLKQMQEMLEGMGMSSEDQDDPMEEINPEKIRDKIKDAKGVKVVSTEEINDEAKGLKGAKIVVEFESLEALYNSGLVSNVDIKLEKVDGGNYKLTRQVGAGMAPDAENPEAAAMAEAMLGMFEPFMADMQMAFDLTLPTAIVETSGEIIGANKVRWSVGFKDLTNATKLKQTVVFGGEGLSWKPFDVKAAEVEARQAAAEDEDEGDDEGDDEDEGMEDGE